MENYTEQLEDWVLALMMFIQRHPEAWEEFTRHYPKSADEMDMWRQTYVLNLEGKTRA